jgi:hypothetical protein
MLKDRRGYGNSATRTVFYIRTHCARHSELRSYKYDIAAELWSYFEHNLYISNTFFGIMPNFHVHRWKVFYVPEGQTCSEIVSEQEQRLRQEGWENFISRSITTCNLVQVLLNYLISAGRTKWLGSTHDKSRNSYKILYKVLYEKALHGKFLSRWNNNIKMVLRGVGV